MLVGFSEIHHSRSNEDTAERVRGGQEGRLLDGNGSAGDFPYGYRSEYLDPQAALSYRGRGPRPHKRVVIDEPAATVVRQVFERFAGGESISAISRWLTSVQQQIPRIGKRDWHHQHVRRILTNAKSIGIWQFGKTTTVRDGSGKKKQVDARKDQKVITKPRPELRIIDQPIWEQAQGKLATLMKIYGMKEGHKRRGPAQYYRLLYPKTLLGGLMFCAECGIRLVTGSAGDIKRMMCPKHRVSLCHMTARVPYERAEQKILELFREVLIGNTTWVSQAVTEMHSAIAEMAKAVPNDLSSAETQLAQTEKELGHLVAVLTQGLDSEAVRQRLRELEAAKTSLEQKVAELRERRSAPVKMPDEQWVHQQLADLAQLLRDDLPRAAPMLREILGRVVAEEVKIPGKERGYSRLRFRIDGWTGIRAVLGAQLPPTVLAALSQQRGEPDEFVIDLGSPTRLDELGPKIVELRAKRVKWIGHRARAEPQRGQRPHRLPLLPPPGVTTDGYNPALDAYGGHYYFKTEEGATYTINASTGRVASVVDANGNALTFVTPQLPRRRGRPAGTRGRGGGRGNRRGRDRSARDAACCVSGDVGHERRRRHGDC